jgi:hypothetical protein
VTRGLRLAACAAIYHIGVQNNENKCRNSQYSRLAVNFKGSQRRLEETLKERNAFHHHHHHIINIIIIIIGSRVLCVPGPWFFYGFETNLFLGWVVKLTSIPRNPVGSMYFCQDFLPDRPPFQSVGNSLSAFA